MLCPKYDGNVTCQPAQCTCCSATFAFASDEMVVNSDSTFYQDCPYCDEKKCSS